MALGFSILVLATGTCWVGVGVVVDVVADDDEDDVCSVMALLIRTFLLPDWLLLSTGG